MVLMWTAIASAAPSAQGWIVWASNRVAHHDIYVMRADGTEVRRLTTLGGTMPAWAPDGRWISYRAGDGSTHVLRPDGTEDTKVFDGAPAFWMHDNSGIVCGLGDTFFLVDPETQAATPLFSKKDFPQLAGAQLDPGGITADGRWLTAHTNVFSQGYAADNGSFKGDHAAVLLDLKAPQSLYFFGGGCEPTTAPEGDLVYHVCGWLCSSVPDLYRMRTSDAISRSSYAAEISFPDADWGHEYFPRVSTDGAWLTYGATTGCHDHDSCDYEVFLHRVGEDGDRTRVTFDPGNDQWPHLYVGSLWRRDSLPRLLATPSGWHVVLGAGEAHPERRVAIKNSGGGVLDLVHVTIAYQSGAEWLEVIPAGSGNSQELHVAVRNTSLTEGSYRATLIMVAGTSSHYMPVIVEHAGSDPEGGSGCALAGGSGRRNLPVATLLALTALRCRRKRSSPPITQAL